MREGIHVPEQDLCCDGSDAGESQLLEGVCSPCAACVIAPAALLRHANDDRKPRRVQITDSLSLLPPCRFSPVRLLPSFASRAARASHLSRLDADLLLPSSNHSLLRTSTITLITTGPPSVTHRSPFASPFPPTTTSASLLPRFSTRRGHRTVRPHRRSDSQHPCWRWRVLVALAGGGGSAEGRAEAADVEMEERRDGED